jgi:hypothetical protein
LGRGGIGLIFGLLPWPNGERTGVFGCFSTEKHRALELKRLRRTIIQNPRRMTMVRPSAPKLIVQALLFLLAIPGSQAAEFGTAEEARAMLDRAVAAVRNNEQKAIEMFNTGEGGFKDRDLYVLCANASDGTITASPSSNGLNLKDFPPGQKVIETATDGEAKKVTYWWPRPGSIKPLKKNTFYTKVGDQICGVGYWE